MTWHQNIYFYFLTCQTTIIACCYTKCSNPGVCQVISVNEQPTRGSGPVPGQHLTTPKQINRGPFNQTHCSRSDEWEVQAPGKYLHRWYENKSSERLHTSLCGAVFRQEYLCWKQCNREDFVTWGWHALWERRGITTAHFNVIPVPVKAWTAQTEKPWQKPQAVLQARKSSGDLQLRHFHS